jgi:site-specific recombinase XerD
MREHLPAFLRHLAGRPSTRTTKTYGAITASFFAFLDRERPEAREAGAPVTRADVEAFLARPRRDGERRAAATKNQELAALRAFVTFAGSESGALVNPTAGMPFAREAPRDPAVLTVPELRRLFLLAAASASSSVERTRNLAIVAVLSQAGLRVHELVALDLDQIDVASATLVGVHGKGGTVHDVPLGAGALALVLAWLGERRTLALEDEKALVVSTRGTRISIRTVERLLVKLRRAMGTAKPVTPHTLRHSCATAALTLGSDLSTVADLLRHADVNTTRKYLHLVDERRREAVGRLGITIPAELFPRNRPATPPSIPPGASSPSWSTRREPPPLDDQNDLDDIGRAA